VSSQYAPPRAAPIHPYRIMASRTWINIQALRYRCMAYRPAAKLATVTIQSMVLSFAAIKSHATLRSYAKVVYRNKTGRAIMSRPTGYRMDLGKRLEKYYTPEPNSGCWLWTGANDGNRGYGRFQNSDGSNQAHRICYEHYKGVKIPADMEIDHLCMNPACVNPDHLEVVTREENMRRAPKLGLKLGGAANGEKQKAKTHCPYGHEYTPENTVIGGGRKGIGRSCRACRNQRERDRQQRLRALKKETQL